jgi:hypothetical protein
LPQVFPFLSDIIKKKAVGRGKVPGEDRLVQFLRKKQERGGSGWHAPLFRGSHQAWDDFCGPPPLTWHLESLLPTWLMGWGLPRLASGQFIR